MQPGQVVYVARYECAECGNGIIGVFTTEPEAQRACEDGPRHYTTVDEYIVKERYVSRWERLRADRIARGADPDTGR